MTHRLTGAIAAMTFAASPVLAQETADYRVTLDAVWSFQTHPDAFPASAHFSPFIGATHNDTYSMWQPQTLASNGMEQMAEEGATTFLSLEILSARSRGEVIDLLRGPFLDAGESGGDTFTAVDTHSKLTVVSMIAPSPDWFVGVTAYELRPGGRWINRVEIPLHAYDAGTDSGPNFTSFDQDTQPRELVVPFANEFPFFETPPVAVLIIERTDNPCLADVNQDGEVNGLDFGAWLNAFNANESFADQNLDGEVNGLDFGAWLANFNLGCE